MRRDRYFARLLPYHTAFFFLSGLFCTWLFYFSWIEKCDNQLVPLIIIIPYFVAAIFAWTTTYISIDSNEVKVRMEFRKGVMKWNDIKTVGYFIARGQRIMFFSTIPGIWKIYGMFGNDLPLSVLIKVFPNKKIEALVKEYYKGEIVYLE